MDKLQAMRTFVRVVEAGSFSAVAHELDATQSAVSKQVAALERALGARLLTRTTRSLALTEEGERYFEQARRLVAEIAEAEATLQRGEQRLSGWLRVAASVGYGRLKLMPLVQGFLARHRDVKIDLRLADGFVDLVEQGIDVAVRIGELADSALVGRSVFRNRYICAASPDYLARHGKPDHPDELARLSCLNFVYPKARQVRPWSFQQDGQPYTITPRSTVAMDHVESLIEMAVQGGGVVQHLSVSLLQPLRSGALAPLLEAWQAPGPDVSLLYPQRHQRAARIQVFVDFVAQLFRDLHA